MGLHDSLLHAEAPAFTGPAPLPCRFALLKCDMQDRTLAAPLPFVP